MAWKGFGATACAWCVACSASARFTGTGTPAAESTGSGAGGASASSTAATSGPTGTGGGISLSTSASSGSGGSGGAVDDCSAAAKLVYVTGVGDELYSFYPPKLQFKLIGKFNCLPFPTHMTVDRHAVAWVVSGGQLYRASTKDATCTAVPTWTPQADFNDFGLTFVGTMDIDNTLYLMGPQKLGKFDTVSGSVTVIGNAPSGFANGDMTSNGDGTLYFLLDKPMPTLYDINPANAAILSQNDLNAAGGGDQALAFWGGSFWAFENNTIYQYDPKAKTTVAKGTAPLSITGAGQSTCVPLVPPPLM